MQRADPFFRSQKPHKNGYLESLHRTYGEPPSALPTRGDELYRRALQYREQEKARYADIERESAAVKAQYEALQAETVQMKTLFEQLSKAYEENGVRTRASESTSDGTRVDQPPASDAGSGGRDGATDAQDAGEEGRSEVGGGHTERADAEHACHTEFEPWP